MRELDYYDTDVGPGGNTVATAVSRSAGTGLNYSDDATDSGNSESGPSKKVLLAGAAAVAGALVVGGN